MLVFNKKEIKNMYKGIGEEKTSQILSLKINLPSFNKNEQRIFFNDNKSKNPETQHIIKANEEKYTEFQRKMSYFEIYKMKQAQNKQKLKQVHTIQKPKVKSNEFYSTLPSRHGSTIKQKQTKPMPSNNCGVIRTSRSQIHDRSKYFREIVTCPRECQTQCISRKISGSRKLSLDFETISKNKFVCRRANFSFQMPCRPWSPAEFAEMNPSVMFSIQ